MFHLKLSLGPYRGRISEKLTVYSIDLILTFQNGVFRLWNIPCSSLPLQEHMIDLKYSFEKECMQYFNRPYFKLPDLKKNQFKNNIFLQLCTFCMCKCDNNVHNSFRVKMG